MASASKSFANEVGEEEFDERRQLVRGKNTLDKNGKPGYGYQGLSERYTSKNFKFFYCDF